MIGLGKDFPYLQSVKGVDFIHDGGEVWYGDPPYYVKLIGAPGTLAGDILRWKSDLPRYNFCLEIIGNQVREVEWKQWEYDEVDPDLEDCGEEVAKLPLIAFDPEKHFKMAPTYKQEIRYLLQCQGSPRIVQLLGRTEEGALVFPKFKQSFVNTKGGSKISGDGCSKSLTVSHICTRSESYTAISPCGTFLIQIRLSSVTSSVFMPLIIADLLRSTAAITTNSLSPAISLLLALCCGNVVSTIVLKAELSSSITPLHLLSATSFWLARRWSQRIVPPSRSWELCTKQWNYWYSKFDLLSRKSMQHSSHSGLSSGLRHLLRHRSHLKIIPGRDPLPPFARCTLGVGSSSLSFITLCFPFRQGVQLAFIVSPRSALSSLRLNILTIFSRNLLRDERCSPASACT